MRVEKSVTSITWIPSAAISGAAAPKSVSDIEALTSAGD